MRKAVVDATGRLDLGDDARRAGYTPGKVVDIVVASSGTLLVRISDDVPVIELPAARPLPARQQLAMATRTGRSGRSR